MKSKNPSALGRKNGSTEIAAIDSREQIFKLYCSGQSVEQISKTLQFSERHIYRLIGECRSQLMATKKSYFDERLAVHFDDTFDALAVNSTLLASKTFLETADPTRIDAVSRAYGILSDKCFILLSAAGNARGAQPAAGPNAEGTGGNSAN